MAQKSYWLRQTADSCRQGDSCPLWAPPLGQHGVNIAAFTKEFNERTKNDVGMIIPVVITVYADRSLHLHHQDSSRRRAHQEGPQHRVWFRCAQQDQGCHHQQGGRPQDRGDQDA